MEPNTIGMESSYNNGPDCSPLNSLYCNLKIRITGGLNGKNVNNLYRCTLCNSCGLAGSNRSTRERAVNKSILAPHLIEISKNISEFGNSYGIASINNGNKQDKVGTVLFKGCTPTHKTPEILAAAENLLNHNNVNYGFLNDETCCGNILFNLGDESSGLKVVRKNIKKFKAAGVKRIITICPGCYNAFNKYYKGQDGFNPEIVLAVDLLNVTTVAGENFVVQDPCHAKEKADIVRKILPRSKNESASPCCGAGAGVKAHDKQLASTKAIKTVDNHPEKIITYCPFCYINLLSVKPDKVTDIYMLLDNQKETYKASK